MKKCILIVEDDPAISRLIESNLLVAGYEPVCAMDGRQALDAIAAQHFDLALCDIMLPELDGFELLPYMQERNIPVIYVSAKADVQSRVQGLRLGAENYLVKPFDILELLVRMEKVLARSAPAENKITYQDILNGFCTFSMNCPKAACVRGNADRFFRNPICEHQRRCS